jgi:hypothetical protein
MNDQWAIVRYRNGGDRAANLVIATCFFDCGVADVARCCAAGWLAWLVSTRQYIRWREQELPIGEIRKLESICDSFSGPASSSGRVHPGYQPRVPVGKQHSLPSYDV